MHPRPHVDDRTRMRFRFFGPIALLLLFLVLARPAAHAQDEPLILGRIDFPTAAAGDAQEAFETGVLALHSFWWTEARAHFRTAQQIDSSFAMAYWGEAMTYSQPGPAGRAAPQAARAVFDRMDAQTTLRWSARERGYIDALRLLSQEGQDLPARRQHYAAAMEHLAARYPDDDEATVFAALAQISAALVRPDFDPAAPEFVVPIAADLETIFQRNPKHPGVVHYLIHLYDTPTFAPLGLRPARIYARIAPASSHALHMPSHIFRALGMWDEMAASNVDAYQASVRWQQRTARPLHQRDYHALDWLFKAYLKRGQYAQARAVIADVEALEAEARQRGEAVGSLPFLAYSLKDQYAAAAARVGAEAGRYPVNNTLDLSQMPPTGGMWVLGYRAAATGQNALLEEAKARIQHFANIPYYAERLKAVPPYLDAVRHDATGDRPAALAAAKKAYEVERRVDFGRERPGSLLYAELLRKQGDPAAARAVYRALTEAAPHTPAYVLGRARTAAALGDRREAERQYRQVLDIWHQADADLPALEEARQFVRTQAPREDEP